MRVLSRTWQMLLKGVAEVPASGRPVAAAEMVLVRIAYAADLPTPDEVVRSLSDGNGSAPTQVVRSASQASGPTGLAMPSGMREPAMSASSQAASLAPRGA